MSIYAHVVDGVVQTTGGLPSSFGNISGFNTLPDDILKTHGFLPFTYTAPSFDRFTQKLGAEEFVIGEDAVTGTVAVVALSSEELAVAHAGFVGICNTATSRMLYDTDWIYLADAGLTTEQEAAYATLRSNLDLVRTDIETYSSAQLSELAAVIQQATACMCSRFKDFSGPMTALANLLVTMLGG